MKRPHLSIVSPVYQSEGLVKELVKQIVQNVSSITHDFEIVLIEDGSRDESWAKIAESCQTNPQVKGVRLSRNFGQHAAIIAGVNASRGEWVVIMDCDLQDRPEEIVRLYQKAQEGYDIVLAGRTNRQDSFFKRFTSKVFYKILSWLSGTQYDSRVANFGIYHRKIIDSILRMKEKLPYFTAMVNWVGFRKCVLPVIHAARPEGKSAYNLRRLVKLAINALLAYSDKPLKLIIALGASISFFAFALGGVVVYKYFMGTITLLGYSSLITTLCFFSGLIILVLGIVGLYIGKIFEGIKDRPVYLISESQNLGIIVSQPSIKESLPRHWAASGRTETPTSSRQNKAD
jgi:dolichol-phosphate mannosyltransferase